MTVLQIAEERPGGDRDVPHAPFDEVARGRGVRRDHQVDRRLERRRFSEHAGQLVDIGGIVALGGADLRDGNANRWHEREYTLTKR
jgi:hypothetical protein